MFVICFEGGNGSGKSTQRELLTDSLKLKGLKCEFLYDPGITNGSECAKLREICTRYSFQSAMAPVYAFYAARAELLEEVRRMDKTDVDVLILDRFELSTFAYQMGRLMDQGMDFPEAFSVINSVSKTLNCGMPDVLIFVESEPKLALKRAIESDRSGPDEFEARGSRFQCDLIDRYRALFEMGRFGFKNIHVFVDGQNPIDVYESYSQDVIQSVLTHVELSKQSKQPTRLLNKHTWV